MNADLVTGSSTTPGGGTDGGGGTAATVGLNGTTAKVASGAAKLGLLCKGADCSGKVTLQPATGKTSAAATTTYGSATFSGKAGKKFTVKINLNSKGKKLLARKRTAKVRAIVRLTGAKSSTTPPHASATVGDPPTPAEFRQVSSADHTTAGVWRLPRLLPPGVGCHRAPVSGAMQPCDARRANLGRTHARPEPLGERHRDRSSSRRRIAPPRGGRAPWGP